MPKQKYKEGQSDDVSPWGKGALFVFGLHLHHAWLLIELVVLNLF